MTKLYVTVLLVAVLCFESASAKEFTLDECVESSIQNSHRLKALKMGVMVSEEDVGIAKKSFLPSLKLSGNYFLLDQSPRLIIEQDSFGAGTPPEKTEVSTQDRSWYFFDLSLEQPLFTGGKLTHILRRAEAMEEGEAHGYSDYVRHLVQETKRAFWEVLSFRYKVAALEKTLEGKRERLRVLTELAAEGYASREEILEQETDIEATEVERQKARSGEGFALSKLRSMTNSNESDFNINGTITSAFITASLDEVTEAAVDREDLKAAYARIKAAEADVAIARSGYFPKLSLQGHFLNQKESNIAPSQIWVLGAQLEWDLFEWGKTKTEVSRESLKRQKLAYENEELKKAILLEIESVWRRVKEQEAVVTLQQKRVLTAEYLLKVVLDKYAEDTVKLSEVIEAEARLTNAYNEYLIAINDLKSEISRLERSAAVVPGKWESVGAVYSPPWSMYSARAREIIGAKKTGLARRQEQSALKMKKVSPESTIQKSKATDNLPQVGEPPETSGGALTAPAMCNPVQAQVGAFKSRNNAESYKESISRIFADKQTYILGKAGYHRVRIVGFCGEIEAVERLAGAGLHNYLLIKDSKKQ